jgi:hypothetical protein
MASVTSPVRCCRTMSAPRNIRMRSIVSTSAEKPHARNATLEPLSRIYVRYPPTPACLDVQRVRCPGAPVHRHRGPVRCAHDQSKGIGRNRSFLAASSGKQAARNPPVQTSTRVREALLPHPAPCRHPLSRALVPFDAIGRALVPASACVAT